MHGGMLASRESRFHSPDHGTEGELMALSSERRRRLRSALDRAIAAGLAARRAISPDDVAAGIEAACADAGAPTTVTRHEVAEIIYELAHDHARRRRVLTVLVAATGREACVSLEDLADALGAAPGAPLLAALGLTDDPPAMWPELEATRGKLRAWTGDGDPHRRAGPDP